MASVRAAAARPEAVSSTSFARRSVGWGLRFTSLCFSRSSTISVTYGWSALRLSASSRWVSGAPVNATAPATQSATEPRNPCRDPYPTKPVS